jgi:hypothetical protein
MLSQAAVNPLSSNERARLSLLSLSLDSPLADPAPPQNYHASGNDCLTTERLGIKLKQMILQISYSISILKTSKSVNTGFALSL